MTFLSFNFCLVIIAMFIFTTILLNMAIKHYDQKYMKQKNISLTIILLAYFIIISTTSGIIAHSLTFCIYIFTILFLLSISYTCIRYNKIRKKRIIVSREFPLLLDFLVMQFESGHSILQAFKMASMLFPVNSPIYLSLYNFQDAIRLGSSTQIALKQMSEYLDTEGSRSALNTISQALQHGTSLSEVLLNQAGRMREQLLIAGEKFSNTLSIKLLIPLLFFIFPASFLVIFSPVFVSLSEILQ